MLRAGDLFLERDTNAGIKFSMAKTIGFTDDASCCRREDKTGVRLEMRGHLVVGRGVAPRNGDLNLFFYFGRLPGASQRE